MSLHDCFEPLFEKAAGNNPAKMISKIRADRSTMYYVDALGFSGVNLNKFVAEENCSIVFHVDDGFDFTIRNNFILKLQFPSKPENVIIKNTKISKNDINIYASNGATIFICENDKDSMHHFAIPHLSKRHPGKVVFAPTGFSDKLVISILKRAPSIRLEVRKKNCEDRDIAQFIAEGKERVLINKIGFSDAEIKDFKNKGATIV